MAPTYFEIFENIFYFLGFCAVIFNIILRGFAYKYLFGEYTGFIPMVGDIIGKIKIAQEYESPFKIKYVIFSVICYALPYTLNFLFMFVSIFLSAKGTDKNSIIFFFFVLILVYILFLFIKMYYSYRITFPLVYDFTNGDGVFIKSFLFTILPFIFYIWIILRVKNFENNKY